MSRRCPCGCGDAVKPGRRYATAACVWRLAGPERRQARSQAAVAGRANWSMDAARKARARQQREQTVARLVELALAGRVREAIQRAYVAGYDAGGARRRRQEAA